MGNAWKAGVCVAAIATIVAGEAEAAGAYGENVRDPGEIRAVLTRGREQIRRGVPAVISVWLLKAEKFQGHHKREQSHAVMTLDKSEEQELEHHRAEEAANPHGNNFFDRLKLMLVSRLNKWMPWRKLIVPLYLVLAFGGAIFCYLIIGKDLLPKTNTGELQLQTNKAQ